MNLAGLRHVSGAIAPKDLIAAVDEFSKFLHIIPMELIENNSRDAIWSYLGRYMLLQAAGAQAARAKNCARGLASGVAPQGHALRRAGRAIAGFCALHEALQSPTETSCVCACAQCFAQ